MLHHRPQVLDLLGAARDVGAYLIDDVDHGVAGPTAGGQLEGPAHQGADSDVGLFLQRRGPRVGRRVRARIDLVQCGAGLLRLLRPLARLLPDGVLLRADILEGGWKSIARRDRADLIAVHPRNGAHKLAQAPLALQLDLQFGDVVVQGIVQLAQQHGVHDLGHRLGRAADGPVHLHVEHDDLRWEPLVDEVDRVCDARHGGIVRRLCLQLADEELDGRVAQDLTVGEDVAQVLGKRGLAGAEQARGPDTHPLRRVARCIGHRLQNLQLLPLDPVGGDVLGDLAVDGCLVLLVELDDLFDGFREVAG